MLNNNVLMRQVESAHANYLPTRRSVTGDRGVSGSTCQLMGSSG